jgi:putative oxidoreductase
MILRRLLCGPAPSAGIGYSLGLLLLRVSVGGMMLLGHGWGKLTSFAERSSSFPDPLGIGSSLSMALATGAEAFCALAVILGFATRWAVVPLMVTMLVAVLIIHGDDPWAKKEFALLYFFPFATLLLTGAGRYSLDAFFRRGAH